MVLKGNTEQGINEAKSMIESGMAYEELYFYLLNYYREAADMEAAVIKSILSGAYGNNWLNADRDFYRDFMSALKKKPLRQQPL